MIPDDDRANLADVRDVRDALEAAEAALRKAMEGHGEEARSMFVFHVGFARGRLSRVSERIYKAGETKRHEH